VFYLPLDKLIDRPREGDASSNPVRPSVTVEAEPTPADGRARVER
jgi:hypothetical protein